MKPTVIGLVKVISIAALIFPVDILAQVNPEEINDFNRERQQVAPHREAFSSKVESAATPE